MSPFLLCTKFTNIVCVYTQIQCARTHSIIFICKLNVSFNISTLYIGSVCACVEYGLPLHSRVVIGSAQSFLHTFELMKCVIIIICKVK